MGCCPPGSSVHVIFQARILEWVAMSFSRGSSWPRDQTQISCIAGRLFTVWATKEALGKELQVNNSPWILLPWSCSLRSAASRQKCPQWGWPVSLAVTHLHFCTGGSLPWVTDVCGLLLFELNHIVLARIQSLFREAQAASVRFGLHPAPFQNLGMMIFVCLANRHSSQRNNLYFWGKAHQRKKQKV